MLIGNVLEKMPAEAAWQLCADKLADWIRTSWLDHRGRGDEKWEDTTCEDPMALTGLREEGFAGLVGLDYIFKWWGSKDSDDLAGELDVIWKVMDGGVVCYKTWIKFAERDFVLGMHRNEPDKRDVNREEFRSAFAQWRELFAAV